MMARSIVLQAIDSPRRDMEWRLFLAAKLAERGISSIIGSKSEIRALHARSSNCIFLGRLDSNTGRTAYDLGYVKEMERRGTALFFIHDEGGLYYKGEYEAWVRKIYPEDYFDSDAVKKVLFWGDAQLRIFDKHQNQEKFEVTGFPRFDLCKPEFNKIDQTSEQRLKNQYGDYVLICGRFAAVNMVEDDPSSLGRRSYDIRVEGGALKSAGKKEILESMFTAWEKVSLEFSHFVPAVARLALDFPGLNFVVRPHPAEKESFYQDAFCHFENIVIDKSGDVRPFIRASKAVIHSECTTGLEAELSEKPNINFRPCASHPLSEKYEVAGAADVGVIVQNYNDLRASLAELLDNGFVYSRSKYDASSLAINFGQGVFSVDAICRLVEEFSKGREKQSVVVSSYASFTFMKHIFIRRFKEMVKAILGRFGIKRFLKLKASKGDLKFYQYSTEDISALWAAIDCENAQFRCEDGLIYVSTKS